MDLAKYRAIFVEDSSEHLAQISRALLELEKRPEDADEIDTIFRAAHSIKGMAASLDFEPVTELAHRLEDRMQTHRAAGRVQGEGELSLLFRGLEALEALLHAVREESELPPVDPELVAALGGAVCDAAAEGPDGAPPEKKRRSW